jgi:hypothetical protein
VGYKCAIAPLVHKQLLLAHKQHYMLLPHLSHSHQWLKPLTSMKAKVQVHTLKHQCWAVLLMLLLIQRPQSTHQMTRVMMRLEKHQIPHHWMKVIERVLIQVLVLPQ